MNTLAKIIAGTGLVLGLTSGAYGLYLHNKDINKSSLYLLEGNVITALSGACLVSNKRTEDYINKINKRMK